MDLLPNEQNFDLDKCRQKFYHGLKEGHKISNIPTFRCEMLQNAYNITLRSCRFSFILYYAPEFDTFFQKAVSISRA